MADQHSALIRNPNAVRWRCHYRAITPCSACRSRFWWPIASLLQLRDLATGYHALVAAIADCGKPARRLWEPSGYRTLASPGFHAPDRRAITPQNHQNTLCFPMLVASVISLILLRRVSLMNQACGQLQVPRCSLQPHEGVGTKSIPPHRPLVPGPDRTEDSGRKRTKLIPLPTTPTARWPVDALGRP